MLNRRAIAQIMNVIRCACKMEIKRKKKQQKFPNCCEKLLHVRWLVLYDEPKIYSKINRTSDYGPPQDLSIPTI